MPRKKGPRVGFPWEQKGTEQARPAPEPEAPPPTLPLVATPGSGSASAPDQIENRKSKIENRFTGESTSEYHVPDAFRKSSARSEVSFDAPEAVEDTRELAVPRRLGNAARAQEPPPDVSAQWDAQPRVASAFKRWFLSDPVVLWYFSFPAHTRHLFKRALWITLAAALVVGVFFASLAVLGPLIENYVRPSFGMRPENAIRFSPRAGQVLDIVEEEPVNARRFRMAEACVWVTREKDVRETFDPRKVELVQAGKAVARLDVIENWDGLLRVYFGAGEIPTGVPLEVRFPIDGGGMWKLVDRGGYRVLALGGPVPTFRSVGPVEFKE